MLFELQPLRVAHHPWAACSRASDVGLTFWGQADSAVHTYGCDLYILTENTILFTFHMLYLYVSDSSQRSLVSG